MKVSSGILMVVAALALVLAAPVEAQAGGCGCDRAKAECPQAKAAKAAEAPRSFTSPPAVGTQATCPVMGEAFTVKADSPRAEYKGKHYVFCCPGCKPKFDADPAKFADK
ncbi:MAG TPA: YHS domain-containing protein [Myxococcota bacterium]|nr:YHS domain-containing protein [Myxococcota bacterium]HRY95680.1 YHS domain-containing protein [Myxococcota bacterium]HSA23161.1 YHS domain-containing protein [Myxococcota bacterium]